MKYLIIGLGNPGAEYENTRHNIGFKVLDKLAGLSNISFSTERLADVAEVKFKGRKLVLVKPNTFMNLSGKAVKYWMQQTKVDVENILVITDDISLPFGIVRMRKKGSDGGHNGLKDIQAQLSTAAYPRLRFGVGNDFPRGKQAEYVLGNFTNEDYETMEVRTDLAVKMIQAFTTMGIGRTMSDFNGK
ncbi:MAG: aminoacyl-tRNA hydrolase [Flavobacteriales bacterium]|jgi:PTH1 family peptidyl-tRNA hydrolase|nr:aminoacyl-tRNA hydrolase [Flavobacteriales bacterium]MDG1348908.1 aminoacyl-tRNA hydrolase [Flavobacteriales bacterium]